MGLRGRPHTHAHTCLPLWLFPQLRGVSPGDELARPRLAPACFCLHCVWCVLSSGPRPPWVFSSRTGHWFFSMFSQNLSVLAFTCSGTEQPKFSLAFLQVINGNLLFPGIDDPEKDAFRRCPVPVSAFAWWLRAAAAAGLARELVVQTRSAHAVCTLPLDSGAGLWPFLLIL